MTAVAFISFRLKAQDGVSVEVEKRISIFDRWGFKTHRVAGYIPNPSDDDHVIAELSHRDPEIVALNRGIFNGGDRDKVTDELQQLVERIEARLSPVLDGLDACMFFCENVFSVPLNPALTIALGRYLEQRDIPCIAIHHELIWQNPDFSDCVLGDALESHYPATLPQIMHVTTSEHSRRQVLRHTGLAASCWRNCFDFDASRAADAFNEPLRHDLGIAEDGIMFLQPTRATERKSIGLSVRFADDFAAASGKKVYLVVSGPCEEDYDSRFESLCRDAAVDVIHVPGWAGSHRQDPVAESPYDIHDLYARSDMVTFPSSREGFGNPVLESIVHRKPLLVAGYPVLEELRDYGFQFLTYDDATVGRVIKLMEHPRLLEEMLERNYDIGSRYFSLAVLEEQLEKLVDSVPAISS